jgi:UDP-N-acetylmuramoyl-L-alanyl-D-glutamate--2,6-diaminopimelate ligase
LAQAHFGWPARQLQCVGITGTNGKSTVAHLVRTILTHAGYRPGLLGTIQYETGKRTVAASMTTPDQVDLADMMAEMVAAGRTHLVMETSSHALDQRRTAGIDFRVGVYTNLTGDHLDYHNTMDEYLAAKIRLFESLAPEADAVLNRDDPRSTEIADATAAQVTYYGLSPLSNLRGRIEEINTAGTVFDLMRDAGETRIRTRLIGRHNVYNCLAAIGTCLALGVDDQVVADALRGVDLVPGRLQRVPTDGAFEVFVDYAHTDDALANVLSSLRPITPRRIIVVFGCGGDRDRTKRPRMAKVAADLADDIVVTSDNPRHEDPQRILEDILGGFEQSRRREVTVQPDRREAIGLAIRRAQPGDVVLIAGKGHETYQTIRGEQTHFDDAEVAADWIAEKLEEDSCER